MAGWQDRAVCRDQDPDQFFPENGLMTAVAEAACGRCPVKRQCLEYAAGSTDWQYGIWGGLSERDRLGVDRRTLNRVEQRLPRLTRADVMDRWNAMFPDDDPVRTHA